MAFRRKSQELVLAWGDDGVLVEGDPALVELVASQLMVPVGHVRRSAQPAADLLAAGSAALALAATHRQYFQFSAEALQRLAEHGAIPSRAAAGFYRSYVRDGNQFAGNLDWRPVNLSPEQALSWQIALAMMALRMAVADVQKAVERVEGKVDQLVRLVRAERLGHVLGDRQVLSSLVARLDAGGSLSDTDWQSVAHMGPDMVRDLEAQRSYLRLALENDPAGLPRHRVGAASDLLDDALVRESLALLVVSESNLGLWQRLRIAQVARTEPAHLDSTVAHAREFLASQRAADQALVDRLTGFAEQVAEPTGIEGLTAIQKVRIKRVAGELSELTAEFAEQRCLDVPEAPQVVYPGARESAAYVARRTKEAGTEAVRSAGAVVDALRNRSDDEPEEPPAEIPPATDPTAE